VPPPCSSRRPRRILAATEEVDMADVYERFGGPLAVEELVARLDQLLLLDPRTADVFAGVDLVSLADHQHDLVAMLLGGRGDYRGRGLRQAHAGLGLDDGHFDAFLEHLAAALAAMGTAPDVTDDVTAAFAALRDDVVGA
jgi:truncated hemoglobin YjbI